ncbi:MAG: protein kinase [Ruminococcus sp.]|nr:protein kinase [Ruminococcus sp.]
MKLFYEKYIKLAHIGKGANAHVYKVRHAELGYVRAIKILNDYIESKGDRTYLSFIKECKTLLAIGNGAHPNIVRIYGPDLIDNHAVVEMDYVQGITLDSYIREKEFIDYNEVIRFILDIVGALAYTHYDIYRFLMNADEDLLEIDPNDGKKYIISREKEVELVKKYGISHNDLHSNNIMRRDYDGHFVLLDFGLAVQDGKCVKSSRMGDGNPEYQAPEKFDNETVDPRSDVYSLGILMYEMLAGRVPFKMQYDNAGKVSQRAINDVLNKHLKATPPPILPIRKAVFEKSISGVVYKRDYPEWLDSVIMKCLAKNPKERYENAKVLLDDIKHFLEDISFEKEIVKLNKKISELTTRYSSENKEKEKLYAESYLLKAQQIRLSKEYEAVLAKNKELKNRLDTIMKAQSNENIQEELRRLNSENEILISQWKYEKEEKERLIASSPINNMVNPEELHELRYELKNMSEQWAFEKKEKDKLQIRIQEMENSNKSSLRKSLKRWYILSLVSFIPMMCIGIWGYCMKLNYETTNWRFETLKDELEQKGLFSTLTGEIITIDENANSTHTSVDSVSMVGNQEIDTPLIEYRTSPEIQKELNQLKLENNRLKGQVERLLSNISN